MRRESTKRALAARQPRQGQRRLKIRPKKNDSNPQATPADQLQRIVGGETTMWAECVDSVIFDSIVWPRAAAAAEKLWSTAESTTVNMTDLFFVGQRLAEHRCRLVARGIRAAPLFDDMGPRQLNGGCV